MEQRSIAKIVLGPQLETHHLEEKNPSPLLLMAKKIIDESLESGTINPCQGNQEQVNDAMQYLQLKGFIVRNGENFDLTELGKEFMGMLNKDQLPSTQKSE